MTVANFDADLKLSHMFLSINLMFYFCHRQSSDLKCSHNDNYNAVAACLDKYALSIYYACDFYQSPLIL